MHAGVKYWGIHAYILTGCILHGDVAVTGETVGLRMQGEGSREEKHRDAYSDEPSPPKGRHRNCRFSVALLVAAQ